MTIVGVVNDIRRAGKTDKINPEVYLCAAQTTLYPVRLADFAVRTAGDPRQLVNAISRQIWQIDKDQPVTNVRTMDEIIDLSVSERRFQTLLLAVFAVGGGGLGDRGDLQRAGVFGEPANFGAGYSHRVGRRAAQHLRVGAAAGGNADCRGHGDRPRRRSGADACLAGSAIPGENDGLAGLRRRHRAVERCGSSGGIRAGPARGERKSDCGVARAIGEAFRMLTRSKVQRNLFGEGAGEG